VKALFSTLPFQRTYVMISITKTFTFDAAHYLLDHYGPCRYLHGHTYRMDVTLTGVMSTDYIADVTMPGMLVDFTYLKEAFKHTVGKWDHALLSPLTQDEMTQALKGAGYTKLGLFDPERVICLGINPTAENLANRAVVQIAAFLQGNCPVYDNLCAIAVDLWETPTSKATARLHLQESL
jgi:6-pyruvoyltetrahydropterin/6-carboxytetrahydropterin synthase